MIIHHLNAYLDICCYRLVHIHISYPLLLCVSMPMQNLLYIYIKKKKKKNIRGVSGFLGARARGPRPLPRGEPRVRSHHTAVNTTKEALLKLVILLLYNRKL